MFPTTRKFVKFTRRKSWRFRLVSQTDFTFRAGLTNFDEILTLLYFTKHLPQHLRGQAHHVV